MHIACLVWIIIGVFDMINCLFQISWIMKYRYCVFFYHRFYIVCVSIVGMKKYGPLFGISLHLIIFQLTILLLMVVSVLSILMYLVIWLSEFLKVMVMHTLIILFLLNFSIFLIPFFLLTYFSILIQWTLGN